MEPETQKIVCLFLDSGASMHNAKQGRIELRCNEYLSESSKKLHKRLTATVSSANKWRSNSYLFMIWICSQQCNCSMKRHRFYCFTSFAHNADIRMSEKRQNSAAEVDRKWKSTTCITDNLVLLVVSRLSSYSSSILSSTSRSKDQSNYSKTGNTIRSGNNSKWQARMRETDADKSWRAGHGEPWTSRLDEQGRSNARHSCLVTALHSDSRGSGGACPRTFFWKRELRIGRWCFKSGDTKKNGSTMFMLTSAETERDIRCEQRSMVT